MPAALELVALEKSFTMQLHGGLRLPMIAGVTFRWHLANAWR
jgi:hypothetical protein